MDAKKLRESKDMRQTDFWARVAVQQSAGSRYESGRDIPEPVKLLLILAYGTPAQWMRAMKTLRPDGK